METETTTNTQGALFKVAIALDTVTIAVLGITVFVALVSALLIYKNS